MMSWRRSPGSRDVERRTDVEAALTAATALLARRDFPSAELREKLCAKAFDEETAAAVVASLRLRGALNDERYAQNYVAYHGGRGQGPIRIGAELRRRGLTAEVVDAALAGGPDWCALAVKVCRAKFGSPPPSSWAQRARQARFLQYRGFSSDHIRAATGADADSGPTEL
jgi:regulatory protein